jgi:hypothetical protein
MDAPVMSTHYLSLRKTIGVRMKLLQFDGHFKKIGSQVA